MTADSSPSCPKPTLLHYCHGLESGPHGFKARTLRAWGAAVAAPDMQMSLWDPRAQNGVARSLGHVAWTHRPTRWLSVATGIRLVEVEGGTHGLGRFTAAGGLVRVVTEVLG